MTTGANRTQDEDVLPRARRRTAASRALALAIVTIGLAELSTPGCSLSSNGSSPPGIARCAQPSECPQSPDPCSFATCSAEGICAYAGVHDGIATTQKVGDCLLASCSAGKTVESTDATDSDDGNPCTSDDCSALPPHSPLPDGTVCMLGANLGACAAGSCEVPCNAGQPCDDMNPCTSDVCDAGSSLCVFTALDGDAPIADPDPNDCKKPFCNAGTLTQANNDAEVPDDAKPCTNDSCVGGQPTHAPVPSGTTVPGCSAPQKCDGNGNCANCTLPSECGTPTECSTPTCALGVCDPGYHTMGEVVATQTPQDCTVRVCPGNAATAVPQADPTDVQNDMNVCTSDTCVGTTPTHTIMPGMQCMGTKFCNAGGACVDCYVSANCAPQSNCSGGTCYSCTNGAQDPGETGTDCGNTTCGGCAGDACGLGCSGSLTCVDATCCKQASCADCSSCNNAMGQCTPVTDGTTDGACVAPAHCQAGACVAKPQGAPCAGNGECANGQCVDNFCCSSACGGQCQACSNARTNQPNGTCADVKHNTDPDSECPGAQVCCGVGNCGSAGCP